MAESQLVEPQAMEVDRQSEVPTTDDVQPIKQEEPKAVEREEPVSEPEPDQGQTQEGKVETKQEKKKPSTLESITLGPDGKLRILNQLLIPLRQEYEEIEAIEDGWAAIRLMKVRGAPAIAMVGALSLAVELGNEENTFQSVKELRDFINSKFEYLETARKTACNLSKAKASVLAFLDKTVEEEGEEDVDVVKKKVIEEIRGMLKTDRENNEEIGKIGAEDILSRFSEDKEKKVNVLTHCNTGSLATAGYGTALGVIRHLHGLNRLECVYCTETRPYNQGSRLTAYELVMEEIPGKLIADSMAAATMKEKKIDAVIVGADRIAKNGDVANKIGTWLLAIAARYFKIPFYVAATTTTVDLSTESGDEIHIEERSDLELVTVAGIRIAAPGIATWNPAFDVTPGELITGGIITEKGILKPEEIKTLEES